MEQPKSRGLGVRCHEGLYGGNRDYIAHAPPEPGFISRSGGENDSLHCRAISERYFYKHRRLGPCRIVVGAVSTENDSIEIREGPAP